MISPARSFYGWSNVGLLFVIYLSAMGMVFYGFSVIFPSMVQEMGWGRGEAAFAHTLRALLLGFTAPLVALALQKFGGRNTIAVGLSLLCLGSVLLGVATRELWHWTIRRLVDAALEQLSRRFDGISHLGLRHALGLCPRWAHAHPEHGGAVV